jgi:hypothetical protein
MNYGQFFTEYTPEKDYIYDSFSYYFDNPLMVKTKDIDNYSMYICKIHCLLSKDYRYLIVFTDQDKNINGFKIPLKDIKWVSFQTRTLSDEHPKLIKHNYTPKRIHPFTSEINVVSRDKDCVTYHAKDLNIIVVLLTQEKESRFYQNKGTIASAFETYNTVISFRE